MTTTEPTFAFPEPLTTFRATNSLSEFLTTVRYADERGRCVRFEGDHLLLDHLDRALKSLSLQQAVSALPESGIKLEGPNPVRVTRNGELPSVGDLDDTTINQAVDAVESRIAAWSLAGHGGQDVKSRLDEHFRPLQALWLEQRQAQEEQRRDWAESGRRADQAVAESEDRAYRAAWGISED